MRTFKVSEGLKETIQNILDRRGVVYIMKHCTCDVNLTGEQFHKVVLRAKMEKMQQEDNCKIPYVAEVETADPMVLNEIGTVYIVK